MTRFQVRLELNMSRRPKNCLSEKSSSFPSASPLNPGFSLSLALKNTGEFRLLTRTHPRCRNQLILLRVELILLAKNSIFPIYRSRGDGVRDVELSYLNFVGGNRSIMKI